MRIWSVHPKYLDTKGIVALWRETLLAKHVLEGKTKGYTNHPQLNRFKNCENPLDAVNKYLKIVYEQALERGYNFDKNKFNHNFSDIKINVTTGQIIYEQKHLLKKLINRDIERYNKLISVAKFDIHPLFNEIEGETEDWEIL